MAIGQNFYADQPLQDFQNLSNLQSMQSLSYGDQAAKYADPFMGQREQYQNQLAKVMKNPGSFSSSPFYKFAYDQGLNALQRKGGVHSGNKLAALMKYGQGMASQQFMPYASLLSSLAMSGSNPGAAGLAYARGTERSQDYAQIGAAARYAGQNPGGGSGGYPGAAPQTPWWMQGGNAPFPLSSPSGSTGGSPAQSNYTLGQLAGAGYPMGPNPQNMSLAQLNAEGSMYGYQPVAPYSGGGAFSGGSGYGGFADNNYSPVDYDAMYDATFDE